MSLSAPVTALMNSVEIRSNDDSYPTANPHTGKFRLVTSAWLSSPVIPGADDRARYLLADPHVLPVIEVAFLNGLEQPTPKPTVACSASGCADSMISAFGSRIREVGLRWWVDY